MIPRSTRRLFIFLIVTLFLISCLPLTEKLTPKPLPPVHWVAEPMHVMLSVQPYIAPYSPSQIKTAYNLPATGGSGTTIAIIDAYGDPSINADLTTFSTQYNLPAANLVIHQMASNLGANTGWAEETALDVEWAHAIAPSATILLVEAKSPSSSDLIPAIQYATSQSGVVAVSMSWGTAEYSGENSYDSLFSGSSGIAFFASTGDGGAGVNWPACSPNVVAVGGTNLALNPDGTVISETGWSGSGGGVSVYESQPSYQANFGLNYSGRSVPDVAYNAGYGVAVYYNSQLYSIGGTSAGAPQWAAIYALTCQQQTLTCMLLPLHLIQLTLPT